MAGRKRGARLIGSIPLEHMGRTAGRRRLGGRRSPLACRQLVTVMFTDITATLKLPRCHTPSQNRL